MVKCNVKLPKLESRPITPLCEVILKKKKSVTGALLKFAEKDVLHELSKT